MDYFEEASAPFDDDSFLASFFVKLEEFVVCGVLAVEPPQGPPELLKPPAPWLFCEALPMPPYPPTPPFYLYDSEEIEVTVPGGA